MRRFAGLFAALDGTTATNAKVAALADYFRTAPEDDRLWTIALLSGRRPRRSVTSTELKEWAAEAAGLPLWLFEECYPVVGDLAETIALLLPDPASAADRSLTDWIGFIRAQSGRPAEERKAAILDAWASLPGKERFLFNKLITGGFRIGVSQKLMTRALARATGLDESLLAHRLMGAWKPETASYRGLIHASDPAADLSRPYPFFLAHPLEADVASLGDPAEWLAEWKWDGIRGQLVCRVGTVALWSRGEELITDRFPEFARVRDWLPDGIVLDGEVMAWRGDAALPFAELQKRIGRKTVPKSLLVAAPAILVAYDLLEAEGEDLRAQPFADRRARLQAMIATLPAEAPVRLSPEVSFADWQALSTARAGAGVVRAEGLMLKRRSSAYGVGRKRGDWWKWKVDPMTVDAVMVYAQAGHGRRAMLYTDFTFAVRDGEDFVPFAKAYSGLSDSEFAEITRWVRANTLERFGPVRRVPPELVFEIAFEGIQPSPRHRSGIALRFPRILRWRRDKPAAEIDTLDALKSLLAARR